MKYFWYFFAILVVIVGIVYVVPSFKKETTKLLSYSMCDSPLTYKIGFIDSRFGLTSTEVLDDLEQATNIWSAAAGKNLFVFSPNAQLTVNFVYDKRQALDTSINQLNSQLKQNNQNLDAQITQYKQDVAAFKQKSADFDKTVQKYNQQGGAPKDAYDQLVKEQQELNARALALNERARELKLSTNDFNSNVAILNNDIDQFNSEIAQKPEQGLYNQADNTITIYFADNKTDLLHTLAHEFGHALGMDHVHDTQAIMFAYTNPAITLSAEDTNELVYACREQSLIVHELQVLGLWLSINIHNLRAAVAK